MTSSIMSKVYQWTLAGIDSSGPGQGGIVVMIAFRALFPSARNWKLTPGGIEMQIPGSTFVISSLPPFFLIH